jgi:CBS domain-containing protein
MTNVWPGLTARNLMRTDVVTISETATLAEIVQALLDNRITGMPVTDEAGQLVGVVSIRDVLDHLSDNPAALSLRRGFYAAAPADDDEEWDLDALEIPADDGTTARDVMTADVYAVTAEADLRDVAAMMVSHGIHRVLVTEGEDYVGLVAAMDVLEALVRR